MADVGYQFTRQAVFKGVITVVVYGTAVDASTEVMIVVKNKRRRKGELMQSWREETRMFS